MHAYLQLVLTLAYSVYTKIEWFFKLPSFHLILCSCTVAWLLAHMVIAIESVLLPT